MKNGRTISATALAAIFALFQAVAVASAGNSTLATAGTYKYSAAAAVKINCASAKRLVRRAGFSRVRTIECEAPVYTYRGVKNGWDRKVFVNAITGRVSYYGHYGH